MVKILVVEDEKSLRMEMAFLLQFEGYEVTSAEDGEQALEMARKDIPDLIISDVLMPRLDGYGLLLALRDDEATESIPFIFLTGQTSYSDLRRGMSSGADDYLTKPFNPPDLFLAIKARLEKSAKITRKRMKEVDSIRKSVVTAMPHELRTPLVAIMGYVDLMLNDISSLKPEQVQRMLLRIQRSANRLYRLIQNYTLFTQLEIIGIEAEKLELLETYSGAEPSEPVELVDRIATERAVYYERRGDLTLDVEPCSLRILPDDFNKIVDELLDNAFKFSKSGTPVYVGGRAEDGHYRLIIQDQGRGMTAEQKSRIGAMVQFDRQIYEQQGAGLGLTLAWRLVDLYKGQIAIESEPDKGCTIQILLPPLF